MAAHLCMHCACSPVLSLSIQAKQYKTQDKWLKQLASFRDEQVRSSCNNEKHGVMPAERESHLHITAEHELEHIYACQDQCEPCSPRAVPCEYSNPQAAASPRYPQLDCNVLLDLANQLQTPSGRSTTNGHCIIPVLTVMPGHHHGGATISRRLGFTILGRNS